MTLHAGERLDSPPETERGVDARDRYGKTSGHRRWWSYEWWFGHNFSRDKEGRWDSPGGAPPPPKRDTGTLERSDAGLGTRRRDTKAAKISDARKDYEAYLNERYDAAEAATRGNMLNKAGKAAHISAADFFAVDARHRPGRKWMSDELRAWFGDSNTAAGQKGGRGGILSFTAYRQQTSNHWLYK